MLKKFNDMKKLSILTLVALCLTGCWTSIRTVAPVAEYVAPVKTVYSTTVTTPTPKHTTVTTVTVTNYNTDMSFYLDLNAVAAAFAESKNVREFEQLLNSGRYMINNLDLNRDGWIDYLRVIETHRGSYHTMLIQACLAPSVFQDVATLVAEHRPNALYVEVIGDRWLYGPNYIVRPVFIKRPPMWDVFARPSYAVWSSPYYYGYWPNYYTKPKPVYLNHYQAYVSTYMTNHHYCRHCDYMSHPFYSGYTSMTQPYAHNDYASQHPSDSFENRVTNTVSTPGVSVRNAGELRTEVERQTATTRSTTSGVTSRTSQSSSTSTSTGSATSRTSGTTSSSATSRTSGSTASSSTSRTSGTTQSSSSSGATTRQPSSTTRTATTRQPSTSVESRVNRNGTTRTTIRMTDETGRTQTVQRTSSTTRSSNNATRESGASRTSSSTPVRSSQGTTSESSPRSSQPSRSTTRQ